MIWTIDPWQVAERVRRDFGAACGEVGASVERSSWFPPINAYEDAEMVTVVAEIPGTRKEDVSITLVDDILTISGRRSPNPVAEKATLLRREIAEGAFEKRVKMPVKVDEGSITASYRDGVLTIVLPKAAEAKPRTITIE